MKRSVAISLFALFTSCLVAFAATNLRRETVTWTAQSRTEWLIEFTLPELRLDSLNLAGSSWVDVTVPGLNKHMLAGEPALPFQSVWCPANIELGNLEIVSENTRVVHCAPPLPAPETLDRTLLSSASYLPNPDVYSQVTPYPAERIAVQPSGKLGGSAMTLLSIHPLSYDFLTETLSITEHLTLRLTLPPGSSLDQANAQTRRDWNLMQKFAFNPPNTRPPEEVTQPRLWIVTENEYLEVLDEWRNFKTACGLPSEIINFSDVATDANSLRDHLQSRYENGTQPAEFLLLVGDVSVIPAFYGVGSSLTDHPYSLLSGTDFLPDIAVGRIPCASSAQLSQWLARALTYERDGNVQASDNAIVFSSSVALDPQHGTHVNSMFQSAGLNTTHLQQPQSGALPLLVNALSDNPLWTFYIGHGSATSWSSVAPHLTIEGIQQISPAHPSIVVSVACATSDFDEPQACMAEQWTMDLLNGGALCYVGATESTAFFYSDTIGLATLEAIFEQGYEHLGEALDYGKISCAQAFPQSSGGLTEETIQQFVLLGDPSLRPYTSTPTALQLELPATLPLGSSYIPVTVRSTGQPVENAEVVLTSDVTMPRIVRTDPSGFALLPLPFTTQFTWMVTAVAHNHIPQQHSVIIAPIAGPLIQLVEIEFDETSGDYDGRVDRGESGTARFLLRNAGTSTSPSGQISLETSGFGLSLMTALLEIPELPAQSENWLDATSNYSVANSAQDRQIVRVQSWFVSGETTQFAGLQPITLNAPSIEIQQQQLLEAQGDGDGLIEAGELLELQLIVVNRGGEPLRHFVADCSPSFEYLHIQDTRWSADSLGVTDVDTVRYHFTCDEQTPRGYQFEYSVGLTGDNCDTTYYWGHHRIGQVPVLLYVLDAAPQQIPGVVAALDVLGIEHESATQLPTDLTRFSSIWIFCGVHPNQEAISAQAAQRIANYLEDGGNCYWEGADVWAFDNQTVLHPFFGIEGIADGAGDAGPLSGVRGRFTDGMSFAYAGENSFIDRVSAQGSAVEVLRNSRDGATYTACVANAGDNYRTIGCSIEIGALNDQGAPSTRVHLIREFLNWFGIPVLHDVSPPVITHVPPTIWRSDQQPIPLFADVQDDSEIDYVAVDYRLNGGSLASIGMQHTADGYSVELPAQPYGTRISYRLRATDRSEPQNTVLTDEFEFSVLRAANHVISVIPEHESLIAMRKRGSSGIFSLCPQSENPPSVVLMNDKSRRQASYVSEELDLSQFSSPGLEFNSQLLCKNSSDPVGARVMASTDGGRTYPHLIWREGASEDSELRTAREGNLGVLAGQSSVILKFTYYGDGYWEISEARFVEQNSQARPVRELVVKPAAAMTLYWRPAQTANYEYVIYAASSSSDSFLPIATTSDTIFKDFDWINYPQRFYRVIERLKTPSVEETALDQGNSRSRVARSYAKRRQ
jgi:hypothetical protein